MKVALLLVEDFEIVEALTPLNILRRAKIEVDTISVFNNEYVKSAINVVIKSDKLFKDIQLENYDVIILPGGAGTDNYNKSNLLLENIKKFNKENKIIASICAAPTVIAKLGLLKDKKATCYPSVKNQLIDNQVVYTDEDVVINDNIITARAVSNSMEFSLTLLEMINGSDVRKQIEKSIVL